MVLNYIWIAFFLIAFVVALVKLLFFGDVAVFGAIMDSTFSMAKLGFELSLGLTGVMTLWLGIMKIGENGGAIKVLARVVSPLFNRLFPEIPKNHPVHGSMVMNVAANMLGLDNAATPLGLKAMNELQELNPKKDTASNAMIMFLVLNTSGLTLIPISILVYRAQMGAANPSDVFIPILISTFFSTIAGLLAVSAVQKINLINKTIIAYLGVLSLFIAGLIWYFSTLPADKIGWVSALMSNVILFTVIIGFIVMALRKKVNIYESFIEGAKEGFSTAIKIIPYLIAILVGIGVFRASGAMDFLIMGIAWFFTSLGFNSDFVPALPVAIMKPLSGSGARGLMVDAMSHYGADSFVGRLTCVLQGATDTTFYIIAVYFGSVSIRKTRHALSCGLIADLAGIIAAIVVSYLFFH
ncbi:MAG TPA: nucleoside recognition domain-containing protein [Bacteroidales bacterium]|nr:nucleoside recognition domain-containing protein [Bacteroidales bacterium]